MPVEFAGMTATIAKIKLSCVSSFKITRRAYMEQVKHEFRYPLLH